MTSADTPSPKARPPRGPRLDGPDSAPPSNAGPVSGSDHGVGEIRLNGYADSLARRQRMLGAVLWGLLLLVLVCT